MRPTAGRPTTATTPASATAVSDPADAGQRPSDHARVGVCDRRHGVDQGDADRVERRRVRHDSGQRLGDRCAIGAPAVAVHLSRERRVSHRPSRRRDLQRHSVYFTTPDAHLVALDANDGKVKWNVVIADPKKGYWSTNAPLVIRDHLIVGVAGDFDNLPGMLKSIDPETGATQWIFYSTPPPGTPGNPSDGATGGQMWMTGTFDPRLNLLFVGTGNPDTRAERSRARWRQPLDRQHRRDQSRHRQARLGLSRRHVTIRMTGTRPRSRC